MKSKLIKGHNGKAVDPAAAKKRKYLYWGIGLVATGALSFFGWQYYTKHKQQSEEGVLPDMPSVDVDPPASNPAAKPKPKARDGFPLKKGSKGPHVKAVQDALIAKHGAAILPKFGADGDFGSEMVAALKKAGLPSTIDESTFHVLTAAAKPEATNIGLDFYKAAASKDFNKALTLLKSLRNVADYQAASNAFQNYRVDVVRQTLVNGMLNAFTDATQKEAIRMQFLRMGLKYDGNKWALNGLEKPLIITTRATKVWRTPTESVPVPVNMVLGQELERRNNYCLFENDGLKLLVNQQDVTYYQ